MQVDLCLSLLEESFKLRNCVFLVNFRLILDVSGTSTESQGGEGLHLVERVWAASDDEGCARVASQGLLQYAGEF